MIPVYDEKCTLLQPRFFVHQMTVVYDLFMNHSLAANDPQNDYAVYSE